MSHINSLGKVELLSKSYAACPSPDGLLRILEASLFFFILGFLTSGNQLLTPFQSGSRPKSARTSLLLILALSKIVGSPLPGWVPPPTMYKFFASSNLFCLVSRTANDLSKNSDLVASFWLISVNPINVKNKNRIILLDDNLYKVFKVGLTNVVAVDDVSFEIEKNDSVSIVGESGSGKTTIANLILGVETPTSGSIKFENSELDYNKKELRKKIQFVQQNPLSSLNPKKTIYQTLELPLKIHNICSKKEIRNRVIELLNYVDLDENFLERHPYSLSGGQRQRISIARALACEPEIIIFDEPTSALDVLIQLKILNLLSEIKEKLNLTYIFITHDLAVVRNISDKTIVMHNGKIVEMNKTKKVFESPETQYTKELIRSIPTITDAEEQAKPWIVLKNK